jgi:hypothetical protein
VTTATTVLFDLDGTLTDPFEGITLCHQYALRKLGMEPVPTQQELARHIGPPLRRAFAELLGETATRDDIELAVAAYRERFSSVGLFENVVYPGVETMLEALSAGHRLFLVTSKVGAYGTNEGAGKGVMGCGFEEAASRWQLNSRSVQRAEFGPLRFVCSSSSVGRRVLGQES